MIICAKQDLVRYTAKARPGKAECVMHARSMPVDEGCCSTIPLSFSTSSSLPRLHRASPSSSFSMSTDEEIKQITVNVVDRLASVEESFRLAKLDILKKESELFRPLYAKREKITTAVPRFWSTVLSIEDELSAFIQEAEADLLKSCTVLRIERLEDPRNFSLMMSFTRNAYLQNSSCEMTKHFTFDGGRLTSRVVNLDWKDGKDLVKAAASQGRLSFFSLFSFIGTSEEVDEDSEEDDPQIVLEDIAMLLADEVYPHALSYYTDALLPPETPADSPYLNPSKKTPLASGAATPYMALESMTTSFLDQQNLVLASKDIVTPDVSDGKSQYLAKGKDVVEKYATSVSLEMPDFLVKHRQESIDAFNEIKMVTVNQAQLLYFLASSLQVKSVLEIGCFTGYSAMTFAHAGATEVVTLEIDPELASFAKLAVHAAKLSESVRIVVGDAHKSIEDANCLQGSFDLIFVDAEKEGYVKYLETILTRGLLKRGGLIIADNTLRRGVVATGELPKRHLTIETPQQKAKNDDFELGVKAIQEFNQFVKHHEELEGVMVPVYDGFTLIRYKKR